MQDYLEIGLRRKWFIIFPLVICVLGSFCIYKFLPKAYRATTLILVQPQAIPENYVRPTVTDTVANRLNTISQEILSRTRLEKVIQEFNLYPEIRKARPLEEVIEIMRTAIDVRVQEPRRDATTNSFSVSYEGEEPKIVMMVTNKLASLFIEENLRVRENRAEGTSEFLNKELQGMDDRLKRKEYDIRNFRERSMGQLPQQLDANLRILERLQQQIKTTNESLRAAEDRIIVIQNQIELLKKREPTVRVGSQGDVSVDRGEDPLITQFRNLKKDLAVAQSKYTENHPDVIDLKKKIAGLEPKIKRLMERASEEKVSEQNLPPPSLDPDAQRLLTQYTEQLHAAVLETKRLREEEKELKQQVGFYQRRIEDTPRREQELALLTRDYDLLKTNYQSLMDKKIQAQMAENLERKQQGEQFKILDPARVPEKPVKPDRNKILLIGAAIGFALGLGLTWFRESMDQSFHTVSDVESYLELPVLAMIPNLRKEEKKAA